MPALDEIIHQPVRLRVMAMLTGLKPDEQADFTFVRNELGLTDGNLSVHLGKLEAAGYIDVDKAFVNRKPRTYLSATTKGRRAFKDHVATLERILKSSR